MRQGTPRTGPRHTNDSRIAKARIAAGLTQAQLAARIGLSPASIANWENGSRHPKMSSLQRIAEALGISWLELVEK